MQGSRWPLGAACLAELHHLLRPCPRGPGGISGESVEVSRSVSPPCSLSSCRDRCRARDGSRQCLRERSSGSEQAPLELLGGATLATQPPHRQQVAVGPLASRPSPPLPFLFLLPRLQGRGEQCAPAWSTLGSGPSRGRPGVGQDRRLQMWAGRALFHGLASSVGRHFRRSWGGPSEGVQTHRAWPAAPGQDRGTWWSRSPRGFHVCRSHSVASPGPAGSSTGLACRATLPGLA